ncbi:DoxX family protein [Pyxidicoccus fallax]|uniref:DoxX family protein n=1 Tax=Pyxidicoccus fallax TaxID=394095 RepID=A0A848LQW2_9BACT|nr:DoxX family protein [Pyxidicoccus fallax]NMO20091.1 DoxX family protein [Pyxidicoccus fallax]NPC77359.1 DoxX family protein [Pyxidicoccus fallax]
MSSAESGRFVESPYRFALRIIAGTVFVFLGQVKFFDTIHLGTDAVVLPRGPVGFAVYLSAVGVPFPLFHAYMVCWVEMVCGLFLMVGAFLPRACSTHLTRLTALPLMLDMVVALFTVGVPNALGHPVRVNDVAVTAQAWRLPLELVLLAITGYLVLKPLPAFQVRAPEEVTS